MNERSIYRGANTELRRKLYESDQTTPVLVDDMAELVCELRQGELLRARYVLGDNPELVKDEDDEEGNGIIIYLTTAVSGKCRAGILADRLFIKMENDKFPEGFGRDAIESREVLILE